MATEKSIKLSAVYRGGNIHVIDTIALAAFKAGLKDGHPLTILFTDATSRTEEAFRFFHLLPPRWGKRQNIDNESAKMELKLMFGYAQEYIPAWTPPPWSGKFVEWHGKIYFAKTTNEYTRTEMHEMTNRVLDAFDEAMIPTEDLRRDRKTHIGPLPEKMEEQDEEIHG